MTRWETSYHLLDQSDTRLIQIATKAPLTFSRAAYTHFPWNLIGSSWPVLSFWSADAFTLVLWPSWTFSLFIHRSFWKDQIRFHWRISFPDICRILEFLPRDLGKALSGHVITTVQVETVAQCEVRCFQEPNCLSYNLGPYQTYEHTCELSNSDRVLHPNDLVPRPGYTYSGTEVIW